MKTIQKNKLSSTVVTIATTTEHNFENSSVVVIETKVNDNPSTFTLRKTGPHNSYACVVESSDFSKMSFNEIWDSAKFEFKSIEEIDFNKIYYLYMDGHIIFDFDGKVVPYLHQFNYMGTPFHNECLNLKEAIKVLKNHPWVMNKNDLKIEEIPYYNCDKDRNEFIEVHIYPDKKTYNKLYERFILNTFQESSEESSEFWSINLTNALHDGYRPDEEHNLLGLLECVKKK